jgi:hypothetical protein
VLDLLNYVQRAREQRRWAILVFHEITDDKSDGSFTIADHAALLDALAANGTRVATVGQIIGELAMGGDQLVRAGPRQ